MAFMVLIIGVIVLIVAIRGTYGDLAAYLIADIPGYMRWALAIVAICSLGYAPKMQTFSRGLLALVGIVILLTQWNNMAAGLANFRAAVAGETGQGAVAPDTTSGSAIQPIQNTNYQLAQAAVTGTATQVASNAALSGNVNAYGTGATGPSVTPTAPYDPANYAALGSSLLNVATVGSSLVNMASGFGGIA